MTARTFYGWDANDGFTHHRCSPGVAAVACRVPDPQESGPATNRFYRVATALAAAFPAGYSFQAARASAETIWEANTQFDLLQIAGVPEFDLTVVQNEALSGPLGGFATIEIAQVVRLQCINSTPLIEVMAMSAATCNQLVASIDVGSFTSWVEGWPGVNNVIRASALRLLFQHIFGVTIGLGSTDATNTVMSHKLLVGSLPAGAQAFEYCLANSFNMANPTTFSESGSCL